MQGDLPSNIPDDVPPPPFQPVEAREIFPWLVAVTVPAGNAAALRYNVRYDEHWECSGCPPGTPHFPLDATVNGWLLGARPAPITIHLFERVAFLQTIAQGLGLIWIIAVLVRAVLASRPLATRQRPTA